MKKIFFTAILAMAAMSTWADVEINETTFPDGYFRNWVLAQSYGQDGVLTDEEIAGVTTVNVTGNRIIQSLKGIEYFTAITRLTCQRNKLSELDLSKNIALTWLNCYGNNLVELDLSNNKKLTYLACEGNQLTSLNVSGCTELTELDCQQNQIATLNASGCKALTMLKCYMNQLTSLEVSGCSSLETMWCNDNQLSTIDVSECASLTELRCDGNHLSDINVSTNIKLIRLWCQDNQLTSLNLSNNKQMKELRIYHNKINGNAMDDLINNLPSMSRATLCAVFSKDEQGVMTSAQVKAAKSKGWVAYYWNDIEMKWQEYEGSDPTEPVSFTQDQMATIILPTAPDASKGKYYRLDRVEDNQIIFEQEPEPRARVPYIIVPDEDFSIDPETLELAGLSADTATVGGIRFIGTYFREVLSSPGGDGGGSFYFDIIDQTPDCSLSPSGEMEKGAVVGALRAYLQVPWDDPFDHGGSKVPSKKMEIVLKDNPNSLSEIKNEELEIRNVGGIYDLQGRKMVNGQRTTDNGQATLDGRRESQRTIVNGQWPRIYIKDGRKVLK